MATEHKHLVNRRRREIEKLWRDAATDALDQLPFGQCADVDGIPVDTREVCGAAIAVGGARRVLLVFLGARRGHPRFAQPAVEAYSRICHWDHPEALAVVAELHAGHVDTGSGRGEPFDGTNHAQASAGPEHRRIKHVFPRRRSHKPGASCRLDAGGATLHGSLDPHGLRARPMEVVADLCEAAR